MSEHAFVALFVVLWTTMMFATAFALTYVSDTSTWSDLWDKMHHRGKYVKVIRNTTNQ
jgi:hypothetical protein